MWRVRVGRVGRWAPWLVWALAAIFWGLLIAGAMVLPGPLAFRPIWAEESVSLLAENPLAAAVEPRPVVGDVVWAGGFSLFVLTMTAPLFRYRRSGRVVRQQLRWLMFLSAMIIVGYVVVIVTEDTGVALPRFFEPLLIVLVGFPLAVSMAILRHNLYDLDVVINRTLVYGAVTAALALVYFSSIVLLQLVLPERTELAMVEARDSGLRE